jgi:hypothetical protein
MKASLFRKVLWRLKDNTVQWLWFLFGVQPGRIGFDKGLLTWIKERRHRNTRKKTHICLLDVYPKGGKFGRFTAFWINERSRVCSASVNEGIEDADIVWIYSQDPLPPSIKKELLEMIRKARPGIPVINHPDFYNVYHEENVFKMLSEAGVTVPRSALTERDIGNIHAVYKVNGRHGGSKFLSLYKGDVGGFRPFEFIDSRGPHGLYRKYRCFYFLGIIIPNHVMFSDHWNVHRKTKIRAEYIFDMPELEIKSILRISNKLNLQNFSVDYMRRKDNDEPVFTDINVYPLPIDFPETARDSGYFGRWHILDNRLRLGMPEPSGRYFWDMFDEEICHLRGKGLFHVIGGAGKTRQ